MTATTRATTIYIYYGVITTAAVRSAASGAAYATAIATANDAAAARITGTSDGIAGKDEVLNRKDPCGCADVPASQCELRGAEHRHTRRGGVCHQSAKC